MDQDANIYEGYINSDKPAKLGFMLLSVNSKIIKSLRDQLSRNTNQCHPLIGVEKPEYANMLFFPLTNMLIFVVPQQL
jgi:hypothetical protein